MTDPAVTEARNVTAPAPVTPQRDAPLSNAERQRLYRQRKRLKANGSTDSTTAPTAKPKKPRPGGHKLRRTDPDRPKRQTTPHITVDAPRRPRALDAYAEDIVDELLWRLSNGETLNRICRDMHMPSKPAVLEWVHENHAGFADRYARARDLQLEHWADDLVDKADEAVSNPETSPGARLALDARKFLLSKLKPQVYGDRLQADITSAGKPLASASDLDIAKALAHALRARALPAPEPLDVVATEVKEGAT
jgi:hypothetical protein